MGTDWKDYVVTMFDLDAIKEQAPDGSGSVIMQCLYDLIKREMAGNGFDTVEKAYVWNDSVLLMASLDANESKYERILHDADKLKRKIDSIDKSFAVAVKGQPFPVPANEGATQNSRFVFIKASSYAFANCFEIPKHFKRYRRVRDWYVDGRIVKHIATPPSHIDTAMVRLLPNQEKRRVYAYDGYLWDQDSASIRAQCKAAAEGNS